MTTCAEYSDMLTDAAAALHTLRVSGGRTVKVLRHGEKSIEYSVSNLDDLRRYVRELQAKVDACNGTRRCGSAITFMPLDC